MGTKPCRPPQLGPTRVCYRPAMCPYSGDGVRAWVARLGRALEQALPGDPALAAQLLADLAGEPTDPLDTGCPRGRSDVPCEPEAVSILVTHSRS